MLPLVMLMRTFSPFLLAAAALLLPSCVEWRIGKNIRESAETITALQLASPVDGRLYASRQAPPVAAEKEWDFNPDWQERDTTYYARVPVVEYGYSSSTIYWHLPHAIGSTRATASKPTGQSRLVAIRDSKLYLMPGDFVLPKGVRRIYADDPDFNDSALERPKASRNDAVQLSGTACYQKLMTSKSTLATIAAAPFDYLIAPALTGLTTSVVGILGGVGVGVGWLCDTLASPFRQEEDGSESAPSSEP